MIFNSTAFKQNQKTTSLDNRCLIIVDLDGTLLNQKAEITKKTYNTVKKIINAGHKFCIFTGRPLRNSKKFHDLLNLDTPIVNYNGAFNYLTNQVATLTGVVNGFMQMVAEGDIVTINVNAEADPNNIYEYVVNTNRQKFRQTGKNPLAY